MKFLSEDSPLGDAAKILIVAILTMLVVLAFAFTFSPPEPQSTKKTGANVTQIVVVENMLTLDPLKGMQFTSAGAKDE